MSLPVCILWLTPFDCGNGSCWPFHITSVLVASRALSNLLIIPNTVSSVCAPLRDGFPFVALSLLACLLFPHSLTASYFTASHQEVFGYFSHYAASVFIVSITPFASVPKASKALTTTVLFDSRSAPTPNLSDTRTRCSVSSDIDHVL